MLFGNQFGAQFAWNHKYTMQSHDCTHHHPTSSRIAHIYTLDNAITHLHNAPIAPIAQMHQMHPNAIAQTADHPHQIGKNNAHSKWSIREAPDKKMQGLFGHCPNGGGGLDPCPNGLGHLF